MKRVLLADADPINSEVLESALIGEGYEVLKADSLSSWNETASRKKFHLIIMDESFLSISRYLFDLPREVFKTFERTPIVVVTEYPELVECAYRFPRKARFLLKPIQADEMFNLIRQVFFEETALVA